MASRGNFDQSTTADQVLEGMKIADSHFLITGGSSGLGAETARALASKGAQVTITARNLEKAKHVADDIRAATQTLAATAPELTGKGGSYLANCKICALSTSDNDVADETTVRAYAVSMDNADRLWRLSEKLVGEEFKY